MIGYLFAPSHLNLIQCQGNIVVMNWFSIRRMDWRHRLVVLLVGWVAGGPVGSAGAQSPPSLLDRPVAALHNYARWEKEIAAFEAADRENSPPTGGILFIGSSTIRLWKTLADDYPGLPVINRGFGGSEIVDSTHFADRIIFPYKPKQIVIRAGTNDLHDGRLPREVAADFADFVRTVHSRLPKTEILFIAGNATVARWSENDKNLAMNKKIRKMAVKLPRVAVVDAYDVALDSNGQARPELFIADGLHFNAEGYKLLAERLRPFLPKSK